MDIVNVFFRTALFWLGKHRRQKAADVELTVLDPSGNPSMTEECSRKSLHVKGDHSGCMIRYEGLPLPLIMNGKVQDNQLEKLGQTRFWLKNQLQAMGIFDFKQVFFCSIDHRGKFFLDRKR
jgi:uncharacterized membrane protein YcaP (DUF421 family)